MASRLQVATYVADELSSGRKAAINSAAAWLVDGGRGREARYLARDVATVLAGRGHVLARVTTARPMSAQSKIMIEGFIKRETGARDLELETTVEVGLIGGVVIELPGSSLDASVRAKLDKFVEGMKL